MTDSRALAERRASMYGPPMPGILIALEGVDGAGKTTQADRLEEVLRSAGAEVTRSKEPTTGPWGMKLRESATSGRLSAKEELELFMADRRDHVTNLIRPALDRGDIVIIDRYYYSTAAYQGARGFDPAEIISKNETFAPRPDLLVIIDAPVVIGLHRVKRRGDEANLFEQAEELEKALAVFQSVQGDHVFHVDGTRSIVDVTDAIVRRLFDGPVFRELCKKGYKTKCEPEYCSVRLANACPYIDLSVRTFHALRA